MAKKPVSMTQRGRKMGELMSSGKAKQSLKDISTSGLEAIVQGAQGVTNPKHKKLAASAAAELAKRGNKKGRGR